jgi:hypothetical protein
MKGKISQLLNRTVKIPKWIADTGLWINCIYYRQLFQSIYYGSKQPPSWFDHRIDLYYHWPHNLFWLEKGVLPRKHIFIGHHPTEIYTK